MAIYEYMCSSCNKTTMINRSISEKDPGYSCEECKTPLKKIFSNSKIGVTFNGSGFYSKDK
jgi:putative FmdB family regulatory protein